MSAAVLRPARRGRALPDWLPPELARLLQEVLADPRACRFRLHPARLLRLELAGSPPAEERLTAAERELARVHQIELAWLLREAARLRGTEAGAEREARLLACQSGLEEALACALADGLCLPRRTSRLLRSIRGQDASTWPAATRTARAALELDPCPEGRELLARALAAGGQRADASAVLAASLASCRSRERARILLAELAELQSGLGEAARGEFLRRSTVRLARECAGELAQASA